MKITYNEGMSIQTLLKSDWSRGVPNLHNQVDGNNEKNLHAILAKIENLPEPAKLQLKEKCWKFIDSQKRSEDKIKLGKIASQVLQSPRVDVSLKEQTNSYPKYLRDTIKQEIPNLNFKKLTYDELELLRRYISKEPIEKHELGRLYFILKEAKGDISSIKDKLNSLYSELPKNPPRDEFESIVAAIDLKEDSASKFVKFLKEEASLPEAVYGFRLLIREGLMSQSDVIQALVAKGSLGWLVLDQKITDNLFFKLFHLEVGKEADFLPDPKLSKEEWIFLISLYKNLNDFPEAKKALLEKADGIIDRLNTTKRGDFLFALAMYETFLSEDTKLADKISTSLNQSIAQLREHTFLEKLIAKLLSYFNPALSFFLRVNKEFLFENLMKAQNLNLVIPDNVSPEDYERFIGLNLKSVSLPNNLTQEQFNLLPKNLESIDLSRCTQITNLDRLNQMESLKTKKLPVIKNIEPKVIIEQCTAENGGIDLSKLPQDLKPEEYDAIIKAIPLDTSTLNLGRIPISPNALEHIMKMKKLDELAINMEQIDDETMLMFLLFVREDDVEISSLTLFNAKLNPENASVLLYECDPIELKLIDSTFLKGKERRLNESEVKIASLALAGCTFETNPFILPVKIEKLDIEQCTAKEPITILANKAKVRLVNSSNVKIDNNG